MYRDLQNKARRERRPTDELLSLYALEGFLDRLASSKHQQQFVLKGGVLLAAYDLRRPTRDIDLQARTTKADKDVVLAIVRNIAAIQRDDGLLYDGAGATAETIREEDEYSGVRVSMRVRLATANIAFNVDVNIGDPVWPSPFPLEIPRLLGGSISIRGYPLSMVHAEKLVTALQRGTANTRWRDFADVYLLSRKHSLSGTELQGSVTTVAEHRGIQLQPLASVLRGYADLAGTRWRGWVRKQKMEEVVPLAFPEVLMTVFQFADPALLGQVGDRTWNPNLRVWA